MCGQCAASHCTWKYNLEKLSHCENGENLCKSACVRIMLSAVCLWVKMCILVQNLPTIAQRFVSILKKIRPCYQPKSAFL